MTRVVLVLLELFEVLDKVDSCLARCRLFFVPKQVKTAWIFIFPSFLIFLLMTQLKRKMKNPCRELRAVKM